MYDVAVSLRTLWRNLVEDCMPLGIAGAPILVVITLYRQPASPDGALEDDVASLQAGCKKGQATLEKIAPGDYVVEVDSRAVVPAVVGTAKVTVIAGEDAKVHVAVP